MPLPVRLGFRGELAARAMTTFRHDEPRRDRCLGALSGCMLDGGEEPDGVVVVEAGDGVAEADGGACSEAG